MYSAALRYNIIRCAVVLGWGTYRQNKGNNYVENQLIMNMRVMASHIDDDTNNQREENEAWNGKV